MLPKLKPPIIHENIKMYIRLIDMAIMMYRHAIIDKWLKPFMKTKGL